MREKTLKLGIVANEFFDESIGRMGGFGWAARQVATCFGDDRSLNVEPVFVSGEHYGDSDIHSLSTRLIRVGSSLPSYIRKLQREKFDLLLFIDYKSTYRRYFAYLPRTPIVVWARDPRTNSNNRRVREIVVPGQEDRPIRGGGSSRGNFLLNWMMQASRLYGRRTQLAYTSKFLMSRIETSYHCRLTEKNSLLLPNIIDIQPPREERSLTPKFCFLGRLDPYKRPWILFEIAARIPSAEFVVMGKGHFGDNQFIANSPNIRLLGHADEHTKARELATSWAIINTSVHEGLAVSFQEALKCESPIISSVDPESLASRFGIYVGEFPGSGLDSVPYFEKAISKLVEDATLRRSLGVAGRRWVEQTHSKETFLSAFSILCRRLHVDWDYSC